jgi:hypothetical protein
MKSGYIMDPTLFENIKDVSGFTTKNGSNYQEHICIIFDTRLTTIQKEKIKKLDTNKALCYLKTILNFTHHY